MYFYEILQSIMNEKKLTVADVARLSGLTDSTVRSIITRKNRTVALEVAFKISKGLDVSLQHLNGECGDLENHQDTISEPEGYSQLNEESKRIVDNLVTQLLEMQKKGKQ